MLKQQQESVSISTNERLENLEKNLKSIQNEISIIKAMIHSKSMEQSFYRKKS